jgi:hypothetical protein
MHLNREDFQTEVWKRLTQTLRQRLEELRELNDVHATPERTAAIRGQIAEVKKILALADEAGASEGTVRPETDSDWP